MRYSMQCGQSSVGAPEIAAETDRRDGCHGQAIDGLCGRGSTCWHAGWRTSDDSLTPHLQRCSSQASASQRASSVDRPTCFPYSVDRGVKPPVRNDMENVSLTFSENFNIISGQYITLKITYRMISMFCPYVLCGHVDPIPPVH